MASINKPSVTVKLVPDRSNYGITPRRILLVGSTAQASVFDGSETVSLLRLSNTTSYESMSVEQMKALIGEGDTLERFRMCQASTKKLVPIDLLLVKNDVAASTTGMSATIDGVPAINTEIRAFIYNKNRYSVAIKFTAGQTAEDIATALADAFSAIADAPFTVEAATNTLTIKYKDGLCLKYIPIQFECADKALKVSFADTELLPTLPQNDLFDIVKEVRYTGILWPEYFQSKLSILNNWLSLRFNTTNGVLDGRGYVGATGDLVSLQTTYSEFNSQHIVVPCSPLLKKNNFSGGANFTTNDVYCAFLAGAVARSQTEGADVTDLISGAEGLRDYTGGNHMCSLPLHNMPVTESTPTDATLYWSNHEQEALENKGFSTWGTNRAGNAVISGDSRTLWQTDAAGNENDTWRQLEFIETSSVLRELTDSWLRITCGKTRMTEGEMVVGLSMVNARGLMEKYVIFYQELAEQGIVVKGNEAIKLLRKYTTFNVIPSKTNVSMTGRNTIVTHIGEVDYTLQITQNLS